MPFGFCHLSIVPCRALPDDRSEMVTQLLFGDSFEILERQPRWIKIRIDADGYEGWISDKQYIRISEAEFQSVSTDNKRLIDELVQVVSNDRGESYPVMLGSSLPCLNNQTIKLGNESFQYEGSFTETPSEISRQTIVENAFLYLNSPYLWGGKRLLASTVRDLRKWFIALPAACYHAMLRNRPPKERH
jgi:gamma-D-glutamyl-L-lysine dipeptidyl-peptidase